MAVSKSSKFQLVMVRESSFGTYATGVELKPIRHTGGIPALQRPSVTSDEIASDRQIKGHYLGVKSVAGDVPCELTYGGFMDDLLAFSVASDSTAWKTSWTSTGTGYSAASSGYFYTTGTQFDNLSADDIIKVSGFSAGTNNTWFRATAASAATIAAEGATIASEAAGQSVTMTRYAYVYVDGTDPGTFTVQAQLTDLTNNFLYWTGCAVANMSISVTVESPVTIGFGLVGATEATATSTLATVADATDGDPMNGFGGGLTLSGDSTSYHFNSVDITLDNGSSPLHAVGSANAFELNHGRAVVNGTLTAYIESMALRNAFVNQTSFDLEVECQDPDGNAYIIYMPKCEYTGADIDVSPDTPLMQNMPFTALKDTQLGTNLVICRVPA